MRLSPILLRSSVRWKKRVLFFARLCERVFGRQVLFQQRAHGGRIHGKRGGCVGGMQKLADVCVVKEVEVLFT